MAHSVFFPLFFSLSTGTKNDSEKYSLANPVKINDHAHATSVIKKRTPANPSGVTIISEHAAKISISMEVGAGDII